MPVCLWNVAVAVRCCEMWMVHAHYSDNVLAPFTSFLLASCQPCRKLSAAVMTLRTFIRRYRRACCSILSSRCSLARNLAFESL